MQDSDGDKSDDLVVDVSNEVRASPGRRAAVPVQGGWRLLLSWVGAVLSQLLHRYQQPQLGDEAFGVGLVRRRRAGLGCLVAGHSCTLLGS